MNMKTCTFLTLGLLISTGSGFSIDRPLEILPLFSLPLLLLILPGLRLCLRPGP